MDAMTEHSRDGGRAIFVMDEQGNLYASTYQRIGDFHHSTLADGRKVAPAGEIAVTEGKIQHVTSASGHYHPGMREMQNLADELTRNGLHDVPIFDFFGQARLL
jgi:hypothetical protein